jgi:hypothetical protein
MQERLTVATGTEKLTYMQNCGREKIGSDKSTNAFLV